MPYVYMLMCCDGTYYTGAAKVLAARLRQHEQGRASRYTRARLPVRLVWSRRVRTWSAALKQEYRLKQLPRAGKQALVATAAPRRSVVGPPIRGQKPREAESRGAVALKKPNKRRGRAVA